MKLCCDICTVNIRCVCCVSWFGHELCITSSFSWSWIGSAHTHTLNTAPPKMDWIANKIASSFFAFNTEKVLARWKHRQCPLLAPSVRCPQIVWCGCGCVDGMNLKYVLTTMPMVSFSHYIYQFIPYNNNASVYAQTHASSNHLRTANRRG